MLISSNVAKSQAQASTGASEDFIVQLVPPEKLPRYGTFWSLQRSNYAPLPLFAPYLREAGSPVYRLSGERNVFLVDDSAFDYAALYKQREEEKQERLLALELGLLSEEVYWALEGGGPEPMGYSYAPEDFWIEITGVTNDSAYLTLHGTVHSSTDWYQLLSKTNLAQPGEWTLGELLQGYPGTNQTALQPVNVSGHTNLFFRGQHESGYVFVQSWQHAYESNAVFAAATGSITVQSILPGDVTVYYRVSGTASNGVDYATLAGVLTIPSSTGLGTIEVQPVSDGIAESDETVTITLVQTNGYLIASNAQSGSIFIRDLSTVVQLQADPDALSLVEPGGPPDSPAVGTELWLFREDSRGLLPELVVPYSVTGTASNGADFSTLSGTVTFEEGAEFAFFDITPLPDNLAEGIETLIVTLLTTNTIAIDPSWSTVTATLADSSTLVSVEAASPDTSEPNSATNTTNPGIFSISRTDSRSLPELTVSYQLTGSAQNGVDYTNLSGTVTFLAEETSTNVFIQARFDGELEGDENVKITLTHISDYYLIATNAASASLQILDHFPTNLFVSVVTNLNAPIGIDFHQPLNSLLVSVNYAPDASGGQPNNFARIYTNMVSSNIVTVVTNWSGVSGVRDEVKLATVKATLGGFTNGDMYFSSSNGIGWISADGTRSNLNWCILTNAFVTNALPLRGGLYVDQSGVFSNELIAVTSSATAVSEAKGVWRVNAQGSPTLITNINTLHLEGVVTLTNDPVKWGPWAGKIITGDEDQRLIYAIDANGVATPFNLSIDPEDFDIIPASQDFYACDFSRNALIKLSRNHLTNFVGDLLITQAGEFVGSPPTLFIVYWDAASTNFATRAIPYSGQLEHATFAPISLPPLIP